MDWSRIKTPVYLVLIILLTIASFLLSYDTKTGTFKVKLGLDLKSGSHISIQLMPQPDERGVSQPITPDMVEQTISVLTRRLNPYGQKEIVIQREGTDRLIIEIPEETDVRRSEKLIKQTAFLEFKELFYDPATKTEQWRTVMTGAALEKASPQLGSNNMAYVEFKIKKDKAREFAEITERNIGKPLGIFLDKQQVSAPTVQSAITQGSGVIENIESLEEARDLSVVLNAGALPVDIKILESMTVSPLLGQISLMQSLVAGLIGLLIVAVFMIWYYRLPGLLADIALVVYTGLFLVSLVLGKFVLTLPGIAGFILTIGMAVDANVLIFERLKEELWSEKSLRSSIEHAFSRAFSSILDGHVTTFLAALILYYLGSASVKGFGLTLMIGTFWSMITAVFFTRVLVDFTVNYFDNKKLYGA